MLRRANAGPPALAPSIFEGTRYRTRQLAHSLIASRRPVFAFFGVVGLNFA